MQVAGRERERGGGHDQGRSLEGKVDSRGFLEDLAVERGDTIDGMAANNGKVRHVDGLLAVLVDQRHAVATLDVAREDRGHVVKMATVDLVDDHEVAGENALQKRHGPAGRLKEEI